mmetsp:Transcript_42282/g.89487  ORF Transcript_42282/g.89487 Transcript_42282/m.89487 type:complete len:209 (-) Transcript_42282:166-792(-)
MAARCNCTRVALYGSMDPSAARAAASSVLVIDHGGRGTGLAGVCMDEPGKSKSSFRRASVLGFVWSASAVSTATLLGFSLRSGGGGAGIQREKGMSGRFECPPRRASCERSCRSCSLGNTGPSEVSSSSSAIRALAASADDPSAGAAGSSGAALGGGCVGTNGASSPLDQCPLPEPFSRCAQSPLPPFHPAHLPESSSPYPPRRGPAP